MKHILAATLLVVFHTAFPQDKVIEIEGEYGFVRNQLDLGELGTVLALGNDKKRTSLIRYYNADLDVVWEKEIDAKYSSRGGYNKNWGPIAYDMSESMLVGSPSGSFVYYVELQPRDFYQKEHYITQITKAGDVKNFSIDGRKELGSALQTIFCDEQYFYMLATEDGNEGRIRKKDTEKLILNRFDAKTFAYKRILLDLPAVEAGEHTSYWAYAGQNATEKILVSKNVNLEAEKVTFNCAAVDQDGKVTRTWKIEPKLNLVFIRPARNIPDRGRQFHQVANFDYFMVANKSEATGATYHEPRLDYSAFGSFYYDEPTEGFYVYGLTGPKPWKQLAPVNDGFYIFKYDSKGTLQWQLQQKAPPGLANYKHFRIHATPPMRNMTFRTANDNSLNFSIQTRTLLATFVLSDEGKIVRTYFNTKFIMESTEAYLSPVPRKSEAYLKKFASQKRPPWFNFAVLKDREIVLELQENLNKPNQIMLFKK